MFVIDSANQVSDLRGDLETSSLLRLTPVRLFPLAGLLFIPRLPTKEILMGTDDNTRNNPNELRDEINRPDGNVETTAAASTLTFTNKAIREGSTSPTSGNEADTEARSNSSILDSSYSPEHNSFKLAEPTEPELKVRLLLVSGLYHDWHFPLSTTVAQIKWRVFQEWPSEWDIDSVSRVDSLRLLLAGRFLEDQLSLASLNAPLSEKLIIHLVPRPHLHEKLLDAKAEAKRKRKVGCMVCIIS